jgi:hypothetical protein
VGTTCLKAERRLRHLYGKPLDVGGVVYRVGVDGVLPGIDTAHAESLVATGAWSYMPEPATVLPVCAMDAASSMLNEAAAPPHPGNRKRRPKC